MDMESEIEAELVAAGVDPGSAPLTARLMHQFALTALDGISAQLNDVLAPYGDVGEGRPVDRVTAALVRAGQQGRKDQNDRLNTMGQEILELRAAIHAELPPMHVRDDEGRVHRVVEVVPESWLNVPLYRLVPVDETGEG